MISKRSVSRVLIGLVARARTPACHREVCALGRDRRRQVQDQVQLEADQVVPIVEIEGIPSQARFLCTLALVKIAFKQKPYVQPDAIGTGVKLVGIQVIQAMALLVWLILGI